MKNIIFVLSLLVFSNSYGQADCLPVYQDAIVQGKIRLDEIATRNTKIAFGAGIGAPIVMGAFELRSFLFVGAVVGMSVSGTLDWLRDKEEKRLNDMNRVISLIIESNGPTGIATDELSNLVAVVGAKTGLTREDGINENVFAQMMREANANQTLCPGRIPRQVMDYNELVKAFTREASKGLKGKYVKQ